MAVYALPGASATEGARKAGGGSVVAELKEGRAKALRTYQQEVVTPGLRGTFLAFCPAPTGVTTDVSFRCSLGARRKRGRSIC